MASLQKQTQMVSDKYLRQINNVVLKNMRLVGLKWREKEQVDTFFCSLRYCFSGVRQLRRSPIMTMRDDTEAQIVPMDFLDGRREVQSAQIIYSGFNSI